MLPFKDNIPTERFPIVTVIIIAINAAVFFYELSLGAAGKLDDFFTQYGMTPYEITHGVSTVPRSIPVYLTLITAMFLHGGWLHIGGNMLYLWIFGNNVEDTMGRFRFIFFYLACGVLAGLAQIAVDPSSIVVNIGASGAIAGILGAYLVLFPRAKVTTLIFLVVFITVVQLPAVAVLIFWFLLQLFSGVIGMSASGDNVAYFAHIGGFLAGLLTIKLFTLGKHKVHIKRGYM
ncbi:MAG: rhomboid family intramembrane serine protease [Actinobacteria bacterium]|nr:rhomboid family intramembrane serine protease [Actinomycetota bacterium]MCL5883235.1 rhomboid family intramembrane serine protease [Actinomycetota bacterium]